MRRSKQLTILCCLILAIVMCGVVNVVGQGLQIVEDVEATYVGAAGLLKWSPDGSKLLFNHYDTLVVFPLDGSPKKMTDFDGYPHRIEWVDNRRVVVQLRKHVGHVHDFYTLLEIDTETDSRVILETFDRVSMPASERAGQKSFGGPYRTLEGRPYYISAVFTGNLVYVTNGRSAETINTIIWLDDPTDSSTANQYNGYREWDGVKYLLNVNGLDSISITHKSALTSYWPSNVSHDLKYVTDDGFVKSIDNKTNINLRTLIGSVVKGQLGCGIFSEAFAPNADLLLFSYSCDGRPSNSADSVEYEITVDHVGLYDIARNKLHVIDTLIGVENCYGPAFSPAGDKIALFDERHFVHILSINAGK